MYCHNGFRTANIQQYQNIYILYIVTIVTANTFINKVLMCHHNGLKTANIQQYQSTYVLNVSMETANTFIKY